MSTAISITLRSEVAKRAIHRCEYRLIPESVSLHRHEPDHIVPLQHQGKTELGNLALSCIRCNRYKGPNVGSFDPRTGQLVPFFNPRTQRWADHFSIDNGIICALTPEARVTILIFRLNTEDRVAERRALLQAGFYNV